MKRLTRQEIIALRKKEAIATGKRIEELWDEAVVDWLFIGYQRYIAEVLDVIIAKG